MKFKIKYIINDNFELEIYDIATKEELNKASLMLTKVGLCSVEQLKSRVEKGGV